MGKKTQVGTIGGIRKVIQTGTTAAASTGTTITEIGNQNVSLAQLAALLKAPSVVTPSNPGTPSAGQLTVAYPLTGGGVLGGNVQIGFTIQPNPILFADDPEDPILYPPGVVGVQATGGSGTVSVQDSITGTGAAGSPLQLSGDNASPGNSMLYGTNSSGSKGWYAQPSGSGGSTPTPETVPNLVYWFDASIVNSNAGGYVPCLQNSAPGHESNSPFSQATPAIGTIAATQLNSKNVLSVPSSNTSSYNIYYGALWLTQCTFFAVWNSPSFSSIPSLIAAGSSYAGAFQYFINASGHAQVSKCFVALQAADSVQTFSTNTWYQSNVTYDSAGGNVSFRASRTAGSTATGQAALTNLSTGLLGIPGYGSQCWNGSVAEILAYDRVLTLAEIETIENYLYAKWGV